MKSYVILGFAFLGVAFYQLSGGSAFEPRGLRTLSEAPRPTATSAGETHFVAATETAAPQHRVKATTLVASPAIAPPAAVPAPTAAGGGTGLPAEEADPETTAESAAYDLEQVRASLSQGLPVFGDGAGAGQQLTLASLDQGISGIKVAPAETAESEEDPAPTEADQAAAWSEPEPDIREITGTRVNMRDGPGTIYPVLTKLRIGQEVEVVGDSGTGWLRLRSVSSRQIGWVSASLVSKPPRN